MAKGLTLPPLFVPEFAAVALRILVMAVLAAFAEAAAAQEPPSSVFKVTTGRYSVSDDTAAWDMNLRNQSELGNAWIGYFRVDGGNINQWRSGHVEGLQSVRPKNPE